MDFAYTIAGFAVGAIVGLTGVGGGSHQVFQFLFSNKRNHRRHTYQYRNARLGQGFN